MLSVVNLPALALASAVTLRAAPSAAVRTAAFRIALQESVTAGGWDVGCHGGGDEEGGDESLEELHCGILFLKMEGRKIIGTGGVSVCSSCGSERVVGAGVGG